MKRFILRNTFLGSLLVGLALATPLSAQTPELKQEAILRAVDLNGHNYQRGVNLSSQRGVPTSSTDPGSDGRAPVAPPPTANQFKAALFFSGVSVQGSTATPTGSSLEASAKTLNWPRIEQGGTVVAVLRAQVGAPYIGRQVSSQFGSVISPPVTDEDGIELAASEQATYWFAEPHTTDNHANAGYHYSPHAKAVFATQAGALTITWKKATPSSTDPGGSSVLEGGFYYTLYEQTLSISGSAVKTPQKMYWTGGVYSGIGKSIAVPSARVGGIHIAYNSAFPAAVDEEYLAPGQSLPSAEGYEEKRTLWYDQGSGQIYAHNSEGRVFVELLGDSDDGGDTREHLGFEIVDVSREATPGELSTELGEILIPTSAGADHDLYPDPLDQAAAQQFLYRHATADQDTPIYYATRETENLNDVLMYWLKEGEAGLQWPSLLIRYAQVWPTDENRYSHFLRPAAASEAEAKETAVQLPTGNAPEIVHQDTDSEGELRAGLTDQYAYYSYLDQSFPAHRGLLRYSSGDEVAFERVFSWLETELTDQEWVLSLTATGEPPNVLSQVEHNSGGYSIDGAWDLVVVDNIAYLTSYDSDSLTIIDVSDRSNPVLLSTVSDGVGDFTALDGPARLFVTNGVAYVTAKDEDALTIIDVSDPSNPTLLSEIRKNVAGFTAFNQPRSVVVSGNYAYVTAFSSSALNIIDVTDPANPTLATVVSDTGNYRLNGALGVYVTGSTAYVTAQGDDAVNIIDISNPTSPVYLGRINGFASANLDAPWDVLVRDDIAYVASALGDAVQLFDVKDPAAPTLLAYLKDGENGISTLDAAHRLKLQGDMLVVGSRLDHAVNFFDVSDPTNPTLITALVEGQNGFTGLNEPEGFALDGTTLFVANSADPGRLIALDLLPMFTEQFIPGTLVESVAAELAAFDGNAQTIANGVAGAGIPRVVYEDAIVGDRLSPPSDETATDASGYLPGYINQSRGNLFHPTAYLDPLAVGFDDARSGAIIPVNAIPDHDQLQVMWFRQNNADETRGFQPVYWPVVLGNYTLKWPSAPDEIVLASNEGSGILSADEQKGSVYRQNDPDATGYNPNEEHALFLDGRIYALRDDLNVTTGNNYSSEPFALLDYQAADGRPAMRVFKVLREKPEAGVAFDYVVEAGQQVSPPMPLPVLPLPINADGVNFNREEEESSADLPVNWAAADADGDYGHYQSFTLTDRKDAHWVYRGVHDGLPTLDMGTYNGSGFVASHKATAVVGEEFIYTIHTSRRADSLTMSTQGATPLPDGLNINGLTISGTPTTTTGGEISVDVRVTDSADGTYKVRFFRIKVVDSGAAVTQGAIEVSGINPYTGETVTHSGRPPHLAEAPSTGNSFAMRFYYRSQDEFDWPGLTDPPATGDIVPYLRPLESGSYVGDPDSEGTDSLPIVYRPVWPANPPKMSFGETLTTARNGLPAVRGQSSAQVIYQQSIASDIVKANPSATLHDSTREKTADLEAAGLSALPASVLTDSYQGFTYFPNLPPHLAERFYYDPNRGESGALVFLGEFKEETIGESYLLLNVMGTADIESVKSLCATTDDDYSEWTAAIASLSTAVETFVENPVVPGQYIADDDATVNVDHKAVVAITDDDTAVDSYALSAGGPGAGYVTLMVGGGEAFTAPGDPVSVYVLRVDPSLYTGELKIVPSENPLNELVSFQHTGDMGGRTEDYEYEWKIGPPSDGQVPSVPDGYAALTSPTTVSDLPRYTLGGSISGLLLLSDNYIIMRYRPINPDHPLYVASPTDDDWSDWTSPQLSEGWIKRVLAGINPFNQRTSNLFDNGVDTSTSILTQAGKRWEGDVALNQDTIDDYGLIEIYETVLKRGRSFSIEAGYNYGPANDALLLAAGYLNDLYVMLGDEAWADAANPTIGIGSSDANLGDIATSLFAFKGQVSSLLDEELSLLRGRDDFLQPGVELNPVYNRLVWNYTRGIDSGEVVYALNYNISEDTTDGGDGVVDAEDAAVLYPQGHGDAYGHYLTATKGYWSLLMNENFDWVPRTEAVTVLGHAVQVDYFDERKFAASAAAVARTGRQVFDLTWRENYESGDGLGWESLNGTRDNDDRSTTRHWGPDQWASRTTQGAYLNWIMGNAILPEEDTDPTHEGILKIDRTTVPELTEIATVGEEIQTALDNAEGGLTPLGLPAGALAFDINPQKVTGPDPLTHFEQVYERAKGTLGNAMAAFDDAKSVTHRMRSGEISTTEFQATVNAQELAYTNALIELYGTPYSDDIGVGKTYAQGYAGPDLLHYTYVDITENAFDGLLPLNTNTTFLVDMQDLPAEWWDQNDIAFTGILNTDSRDETSYIEFNIGSHGYFEKPSTWTGQRASPGKLQLAISELIRAHAALKQSMRDAELEKQLLDKAMQLFADQTASLNSGSDMAAEILDVAHDINDLRSTYDVTRNEMEINVATLDLVLQIVLENFPDSTIFGTAAGGDLTHPARGAMIGLYGLPKLAWLATDAVRFRVAEQKILSRRNDIRKLEKEIAGLNLTRELQNSVHDLGRALTELQGNLVTINEKYRLFNDAERKIRTLTAEGDRIQQERLLFRQRTAAIIQGYRTRDAGFRAFRDEKLERYKALFDLAARYTYLAATAYDYETGLLGSDTGNDFLERIINSRALGVMHNGEPQYAGSDTGDPGLSSVLAEMHADWDTLKGRLGFNNSDGYGTTLSLRTENLRILPGTEGEGTWQDYLHSVKHDNLLDDADVQRHCLQLDDGSGLPTPGIVIEFSTTIARGLNLFGRQLAAGDHAFTPSSFATKLFATGVAFEGYRGMDDPTVNSGVTSGSTSPSDPTAVFLDDLALAATPYVYLIPVGVDSMRSPPLGDVSEIRTWNVQDVTIPLPFNIGQSEFSTKQLWQSSESLSEELFSIRKHQAFRPVSSATVFAGDIYGSNGRIASSQYTNNRLIGRSAWNSKWKLVIPAEALLNDPEEGLERFIQTVTDIKLHLVTYSYAGN